MSDEANELRDGSGPLPAELREPLADLLDALDHRDWVGSDAVMDDWTGATRGLRDAARALREAVQRAVYATPPPVEALDIIERVNGLPDATFTIRGAWDGGAAPDTETKPV